MQLMVMDDTESFLNVMAARTPVLTRLADEQGVFRFFNEAWVKFSGRSIADETGNGWLQSVHPEDRSQVAAAFREATAAHADTEIQYRLRRRDGLYRWMLDRASPWRRADGSFGGLVSASTDITSIKEAGVRGQSDVASQRLPSLMLRVDAKGGVESLSPGIETVLGVGVGDAGVLQVSALPSAAAQAMNDLLEATARSAPDGSNSEIEFRLDVGGQTRHLLASGARLGDSVLVAIHDLTPCAQAEALHRQSVAREEQARQKADAASRARDQFLSVVSHELRSPLNGIQSWAHVLESQIDTGRPIVQRALAGIKTGVTQQVTLIEALLDATQIMNGQLNLLPQSYSLNGVVQSALDSLRGEAEQKDIDISFTPELADIDMHGDVERVQQIIRNLISNAIKFTDDGGDVRIGVSRRDDMAVVSVKDNGCGISPGFAGQLFEPFRQVDSSQTRRAAGLGLGLAVSKRIAEMHGGNLKYESEGVGHGSTFHVLLPLPG